MAFLILGDTSDWGEREVEWPVSKKIPVIDVREFVPTFIVLGIGSYDI
jgi:hypothetical protein